jgi:hypothetical protein
MSMNLFSEGAASGESRFVTRIVHARAALMHTAGVPQDGMSAWRARTVIAKYSAEQMISICASGSRARPIQDMFR